MVLREINLSFWEGDRNGVRQTEIKEDKLRLGETGSDYIHIKKWENGGLVCGLLKSIW